MKIHFALSALCLLSDPAFAEGDPIKGEQEFNRQCGACHVVQSSDGLVLAGRNARPGPNLFGLMLRPIASQVGARYGDSIKALGANGATWNEEDFVAYVQDPTGWLRMALEDRRARSKMAYRVRQEDHARDIYAYLVSIPN